MEEAKKLIVVAVWLGGSVLFIGLLAWQIQRGKWNWVVFNGLAAAVYLFFAVYFATRW